METRRLRGWVEVEVAQAADLLRLGGTVAFPTETVYGLGAHALDPDAVGKIFRAKQRPSWDPLIVHVCDRYMLETVAVLSGDIARPAEALIEAFWPGPLTLLLPRSPAVPDAVTAGRPLVGVRLPRHQVASDLIRLAGVPIAAPSANRFGRTSPTRAGHVLEDLDGRIDAVLDGGPTDVGVESTVLDVTSSPMLIYRPGAVTASMIEAVCGPASVRTYVAETAGDVPQQSLPSPGVGLRHYAPRASLVLVEGDMAAIAAAVRRSVDKVGVLLPEGWGETGAAAIYTWGPWHSPETLARRLFDGLRSLDEMGVDVIVCPLPPSSGIGAAVRDRLHKAARKI